MSTRDNNQRILAFKLKVTSDIMKIRARWIREKVKPNERLVAPNGVSVGIEIFKQEYLDIVLAHVDRMYRV